MSFRIHARRRADKEILRLLRGRLQLVDQCLQQGDAESIHNARKRLKEARALLRLVRQPLGKRLFQRENARLREWAHCLSCVRDAAAMVECWDVLVHFDPRRFSSPAMCRVRERLVSRAETCQLDENMQSQLAMVQCALHQLLASLPEWSLSGKGFGLFADGVLKTYCDGRQAFRQARRHPSVDSLHGWRKRVKDHWYQTQLLEEAWPELFKSRQKSLKRLAQWLGDEHDLAVLQTLLQEEPRLFGATNTRKAIDAGITECRAVLLARIVPQGLRLYGAKPKQLLSCWTRNWRISQRYG